ncbi:MAG: hypothetical protein GY722_08800 [bacterium]|nr:hypothetical protein [bacterium]
MKRFLAKVSIPVLTLIGLGFTAIHAGESGRPWVDFDCGSYRLHLMVGGDPSSIDVQEDSDGSIYVSGADGDRVVASCARGCLETNGKAACSIGAPQTTLSVDVSCPDGNTFTMSGGDDPSAHCDAAQTQDGSVTGATCSDGNGNTSRMDCSANNGDGSCISQTGSGKCACKTCDR